MKFKLKLDLNPANIWSKSLGLCRSLLNFALHYVATVVAILTIAVIVLKLPEIHNHWMRKSVGAKVYKIRDHLNGGGGTGFAVLAPSGDSYILTNDHVCGVSKDGLNVLVTDEDGNSMHRRIIAHDENSDLCLVEGLPGVQGIKVARSGPSLGDTMYVVGHPVLMPTHVSSGELTGAETVLIPTGPISMQNPQTGEEVQIPANEGGVLASSCQMNKNKIVDMDMDMLFFTVKVKYCAIEIKEAYITAVTIFPGNSGSPVVNFWGHLEGLAFASDSQTNWARVINIADVKDFLKSF